MKRLFMLPMVLLLAGCGGCKDEACFKAKIEYEAQQKQNTKEIMETSNKLNIERIKAQQELENSTGYIQARKLETANEQASDIDYMSDSQKVRDWIAVWWALLKLLSN